MSQNQPVHPATLAATRCVVTGGLGFIGSNLTHALACGGASVTVIDALVPSHGGAEHNIAGLDVESLRCEIGDPRVREVIFKLMPPGSVPTQPRAALSASFR